MNLISAVLRMVCGGAILFLTWSTWSKNKEALAAGNPVTLFGKNVEAGQGSVMLVCALFAFIGLGLILMGVVGLMKSQR